MKDHPITQLENDLAAVVAKHAKWLDGRQFLRTAERVAQGLFDDIDGLELIDCDELLLALQKAFSEHVPMLASIDQRCTDVDARLDAIIAKSEPTAGTA